MTKLLVGEIWKVKLYPVRGSKQDGIRPCLIVSPNSMNSALQAIIVVPLTTSTKDWPTRVNVIIMDKKSQACIEHIRSVSKERFIERLGKASEVEMASIRKHLQAVFAF
ncbi:MAG: type II toxin-antitoxin system PemK/MazF family toxin [Bdellovibrionales bacterium]|jgi:mRNA interferase MazF|nr:type II toxin-antitoxin system PemK/MazF family toxin [Bdellovibrionales bacterium]